MARLREALHARLLAHLECQRVPPRLVAELRTELAGHSAAAGREESGLQRLFCQAEVEDARVAALESQLERLCGELADAWQTAAEAREAQQISAQRVARGTAAEERLRGELAEALSELSQSDVAPEHSGSGRQISGTIWLRPTELPPAQLVVSERPAEVAPSPGVDAECVRLRSELAEAKAHAHVEAVASHERERRFTIEVEIEKAEMMETRAELLGYRAHLLEMDGAWREGWANAHGLAEELRDVHAHMESTQLVSWTRRGEGTQEPQQALLAELDELQGQAEEATTRAMRAERAHRLSEEAENVLAAQFVELRGEVQDARLRALKAEQAHDVTLSSNSNLASPRPGSDDFRASLGSTPRTPGRAPSGERGPTPSRAPSRPSSQGGVRRPTPSRLVSAPGRQPSTPPRSDSVRASPASHVRGSPGPRANGVDPVFRGFVKEHTAVPAAPRRAVGGNERPSTPNRGRGGARPEHSLPFSPIARR